MAGNWFFFMGYLTRKGAVGILAAGIAAVVGLELIRSAKKKHYKMMHMCHANEKIIDVKYISLE